MAISSTSRPPDRPRLGRVGAIAIVIAAGGSAVAQQPASSSQASPQAERSGTAAGASSASSSNHQAGSASAVTGAPMWLLVPAELSTRSEQVANGCWVRLYSGDDFEGRAMTVVGPADLAELRSPYGTGLDNWESAVVGPNATVTTYDDQDFRARSATLRAGQRYTNLNDSKLGLFEDIESMRVTCASNSATAGQAGSADSGAGAGARSSGASTASPASAAGATPGSGPGAGAGSAAGAGTATDATSGSPTAPAPSGPSTSGSSVTDPSTDAERRTVAPTRPEGASAGSSTAMPQDRPEGSDAATSTDAPATRTAPQPDVTATQSEASR